LIDIKILTALGRMELHVTFTRAFRTGLENALGY